jgi:hypothetical protein
MGKCIAIRSAGSASLLERYVTIGALCHYRSAMSSMGGIRYLKVMKVKDNDCNVKGGIRKPIGAIERN